jgi:hypothetical protein
MHVRPDLHLQDRPSRPGLNNLNSHETKKGIGTLTVLADIVQITHNHPVNFKGVRGLRLLFYEGTMLPGNG